MSAGRSSAQAGRTRAARGRRGGSRALALGLAAPALAATAALSVLPLAWAIWESFHRHDLRFPALGRPFVGLANYAEALSDPRLAAALAHTAGFVGVSVALEIAFGLALALLLNRVVRGRGLLRTAVVLPWALPTVVAALLWRFLFEGAEAPAQTVVAWLGAPGPLAWLAHPQLAWVPLVLADVWKTTPFVAVVLLAGVQGIDEELLEAAAVDGAGPWARLRFIVLPLLAPVLAVALLFRALDAFRVFDLVVVLTGGGPGTATETVAVYTFGVLLQKLRFGYGAALSVVIFAVGLALAIAAARLVVSRADPDARSGA